jgi:hypothetical protein
MFSTVMMLDCCGSRLSWFTTVAGIEAKPRTDPGAHLPRLQPGFGARLHLDVKQMFKYCPAACQDKARASARRCGCD